MVRFESPEPLVWRSAQDYKCRPALLFGCIGISIPLLKKSVRRLFHQKQLNIWYPIPNTVAFRQPELAGEGFQDEKAQ
jgi:hypothetical protein